MRPGNQLDGPEPLARHNFWCRSALSETRGSQIVEFAVALPLIMLFVVGIFDFGSAFGLKQRLANAVREGARVGANQPTSDLSNAEPPSVDAIAEVVGNYLVNSKVSDCGLSVVASRTVTNSSPLVWAYTATGCPGKTVVLTINRGYTYTVNLPAPYSQSVVVEGTQVTLSYPYQWKFGDVAKLVVSTASYPGTTQLTTVATMQNLN